MKWDEYEEMIWKNGHEEGREEGRQEGREEGRQEGREEGRQEGRQEGREEGRMLEKSNTDRERQRADAAEARVRELEQMLANYSS